MLATVIICPSIDREVMMMMFIGTETLVLVPITAFPERGHDYKRTEQEKI